MNRAVQPKKVSPLIKAGRYTFLIAGWLYGLNKRAIIVAIEKKEKPRREAIFAEEKRQKKIKSKMDSIEELKNLFKETGFEPEPGWDNNI